MSTESKTFNWRDYIQVEYKPGKEQDYQKIVDALDKMSRDPRVQSEIIRGYELGKQRMVQQAAIDHLPNRDDTRILIRIENADEFGGAKYNTASNVLTLDPTKIESGTYTSSTGVRPFTLVHAMLHELSHASYKNDMPSTEAAHKLEDKIEAARGALKVALECVPQFKEEYERTGKVASMPFRDLLNAKTNEQFDELFMNVMNGAGDLVISHDNGNRILADPHFVQYLSSRRNDLGGVPPELQGFGDAFVGLYEANSVRLSNRRHENPAIRNTNRILPTLDGSTPRNELNENLITIDDVLQEKNKKVTKIKELSDALEAFAASLVPGTGQGLPTAVHTSKTPSLCAGLKPRQADLLPL